MAVRDQTTGGEDGAEAATQASGRDETIAAGVEGAAAVSELAPGASLGRYRLNARLGAGAMGEVWSAQDPQLDREVAIKVVHSQHAQSADASQRLLREARAMAKLSHRAVVTVHDAGEVGGRLFLAMELVRGTTLGALLRERTPAQAADWQHWLAMMLEAGRGLAAAHRRGVLHRDFKPDNVLVDAAGRVCVGDFGLATLLGAAPVVPPISVREAKPLLDLTTTGALLGTPMYMSPQQLAGEPVDAAADQFAFCVAAFEALYGRRPFEIEATSGLGAIAALAAAIEARAIAPAPPGSQVPPGVRDVLLRGLAPDPAARWPTVDDLLAALAAATQPAAARPASVARAESPGAVKRRRAAVAVAVALAVGSIAVVSYLAWPRPRAQPAAVRMFDSPMRATLAVSADARYLAVASDRLDVHDLRTGKIQTLALPDVETDPSYVEFEGEDIRVVFSANAPIFRWRPGTATLQQETGKLEGLWYGRTMLGELLYRPRAQGPHVMAIVAGDAVREWPVPRGIELVTLSPDRRRVAYLDADRFAGRIVVHDVLTNTEVRSHLIAGPTGLAWLDARTLVYGEGQVTPIVWRVAVTDRFGVPEALYRATAGWFGYLARGGDHLYMVDLGPKPRARIIRRTPRSTSTQDLDFATASAPLAWIDENEFLTWNRTNGAVERRASGTSIGPTPLTLSSEPVNATLAGDTLIVSVRRADGRDVYAYPLAGGPPRWKHELTTLAVRCTDDRKPPCFAAVVDGDHERLYAIDPRTGTFGAEVPVRARIEDFAVSPTGDRIAYVGQHPDVVEISLDGAVLSARSHGMATARSVAYDPTGGVLVAGTLSRNQFQIVRITDGEEPAELSQTDNDILMLVRPSPSGQRILALARVYAPAVLQLRLPDD